MVLKGSFPPGKRIEELDLCRCQGVSRRIVLSVLENLSSEGLLEPLPSGGYTARQLTLDNIRDSIRARAELEGFAAALAAQRFLDPAELQPARKLNAELAQAIASREPDPPTPEEMSRFGDLNSAFHQAIVDLARSPLLALCLERVKGVAFASPAAVVIPAEGSGASRAFEEHEAILNAIQDRDAVRAGALVKQHAALALHGIESALAGRPHAGRNPALSLVSAARTAPPAARKQPSKRPEESPGTTSERILDVAAELFCEKGFYAATTRELATRLEIQQGSLYHHMSNKEDLLHRICREVMDSFLADLPAAIEKAEDEHNRIAAFLDAHLDTMLRHPHRTLAMVTEFRALSGSHFSEVTKKYKEYSRLLDCELSAAQKSKTLRSDIPPKYIRLALLNFLNWTPRWFHVSGALSVRSLKSIYETVFWEGVIDPTIQQIPPPRPLPVSASRQRSRDLHRGTLGKFIRAAAELFAKYGYESTSTRDLATLLGMEKATLYYHVEGKEDLLYAICKSSIEQLVADVDAATETIADPLEQLQVWIQAHVQSLLRDQTQHATALAEVRSLSPARLAEIVSMRKAYQARVRALIESGQKAGCLRADIASKYLGLMLEGLLDRTVVWYRRSGEQKATQLGGILCDLFLSGARQRS